MDSPYRQAELDVIQSPARADKRCVPDAAICGRRRRARLGERLGRALALAGGALLLLGGVGGFVGIARVVGAVTEMKPHPVLLTCGAQPGPKRQAHLASLPPLPPPPPPPPRAPPPKATPFDLPPTNLFEPGDAPSHDPGVLALRALVMKASGAPVKVQLVGIPADALRKSLGFSVNATPVARSPRVLPDGVELATIPKGSLLERAGLVQGDVVLTVNGYNAAQAAWIDHVRLEAGATTVVELLRAKERLVLIVEVLRDKAG